MTEFTNISLYPPSIQTGKTQHPVVIACIGCHDDSLGLTDGPAESVRLNLYRSTAYHLCPKCITPGQAARRDKGVTDYHHHKSAGKKVGG